VHISRDAAVHCTQVFEAGSQVTRLSVRAAQSRMATHSTQTLVLPSGAPASPLPPRHRGRDGVVATQSRSNTQLLVHTPTRIGSLEVQKRPAGQPLRIGAGTHPSMQRRVPLSQTRPDIASPQSASDAQPQNAGIAGSGCTHARPSALIAHAIAMPDAPAVHSTQVFLEPHTGVAPMHAIAFVVVH
jgi:hypothetical protein